MYYLCKSDDDIPVIITNTFEDISELDQYKIILSSVNIDNIIDFMVTYYDYSDVEIEELKSSSDIIL